MLPAVATVWPSSRRRLASTSRFGGSASTRRTRVMGGGCLLVDGAESAIGVVGGDRGGQLRRVRAEVGVVDDPVLVDDERHDAAVAVLGGVGDQRESGGHLSVEEIAL